MKHNDTYKEVKVFHYENAIARVRIPDLSPEERDRRMREITKAAVQLLASAQQIKK